jgi:hypothetical protein
MVPFFYEKRREMNEELEKESVSQFCHIDVTNGDWSIASLL